MMNEIDKNSARDFTPVLPTRNVSRNVSAPPRRRCKICRSPRRSELDAALLRGVAARALARQFGLTAMSLVRHKRKCLQGALIEAAAAQSKICEYGLSLVDDLKQVAVDLRRIAIAAETRGHYSAAIGALKEQREILELRLTHGEPARVDPKLEAWLLEEERRMEEQERRERMER